VGLSALQSRPEWAYLLCSEFSPNQVCASVPRRHFRRASGKETFMDGSIQCDELFRACSN